MEVTRDNFLDVYDSLKKKIDEATFISFDEEMTGIMSSDFSLRNKVTMGPSIYVLCSQFSIITIMSS